jgi:hypothetical protein
MCQAEIARTLVENDPSLLLTKLNFAMKFSRSTTASIGLPSRLLRRICRWCRCFRPMRTICRAPDRSRRGRHVDSPNCSMIWRRAAVARADALLSRDAISPVNCATTCFVNSSAMSASVQDDTMHAPFAALVEWNVRSARINSPRQPRPLSGSCPRVVRSNPEVLQLSN